MLGQEAQCIIDLHTISTKNHARPTFPFKPFRPNPTSSHASESRALENRTRLELIARKLKLLFAAMAAAALFVATFRAIHSYSAQADLQNALSDDVPTPQEGQIVPSRPLGLLACSLPVSDCERIIIMIPMNLKFSPREIAEPPDLHPLGRINRTVHPVRI